MEMGKKNKSQDNELKRVPPENEDEILRNADPSDSSEAMNEPGHGTVDDADEAEQADGNAEDDIDATVVAIESVVPREEVLSANKGMPDQDAGTARDVSDLDSADESNAATARTGSLVLVLVGLVLPPQQRHLSHAVHPARVQSWCPLTPECGIMMFHFPAPSPAGGLLHRLGPSGRKSRHCQKPPC